LIGRYTQGAILTGHFHEKLEEEHGIRLRYSWVRQALQGVGYIARKKKRGPHRRRRPRKEMPGIMLHSDGSKHAWFQDHRHFDFIVVLDDANTEIYYAQLVEEESTVTWWEPLFLYSEGRRTCGQEPSDAVWKSAQRSGHPDDRGLFATSSGADGAQLRHLAGKAAAGTPGCGDHDGGSGQPVLAGTLHSEVQQQLHSWGRPPLKSGMRRMNATARPLRWLTVATELNGSGFRDPEKFDAEVWKPIGEKGGMPGTRFYDLRHFFASQLIAPLMHHIPVGCGWF
jgi:hypothetical protein